MANRSKVFRQFGPFQNEGMLLMILDEINILRAEVGLPPRTKQQVLDELDNHQNHLEPYDWMESD